MTVGTSLFVIAAGAILKFAVTKNPEGFNLHTAGVVLMAVGGVGLVLGLFLLFTRGSEVGPSPPLV